MFPVHGGNNQRRCLVDSVGHHGLKFQLREPSVDNHVKILLVNNEVRCRKVAIILVPPGDGGTSEGVNGGVLGGFEDARSCLREVDSYFIMALTWTILVTVSCPDRLLTFVCTIAT